MHYYKVPRLGSYLAIKLEYNSCLFEDSFVTALNNYKLVKEKREQIAIEKEEWAQEQEEIRKQKEAEEEEYEPQERIWPEPQYDPFKTRKIQYVLCLNTMG
jgi:hypothetical protein